MQPDSATETLLDGLIDSLDELADRKRLTVFIAEDQFGT